MGISGADAGAGMARPVRRAEGNRGKGETPVRMLEKKAFGRQNLTDSEMLRGEERFLLRSPFPMVYSYDARHSAEREA